ncbi:MAG: aminoglycoside phosphotransferase family protein [Clostridia bacterium]|nr:aminoglycoside phosphotransferase family protein [Clostridia bacterium]
MENLFEITSLFLKDHKAVSIEPYGCGHINSTYIVISDNGEKFILQKINTNIFKDANALMHNVKLVTNHIKKKSEELGRNKRRSTINFLHLKSGKHYAITEYGAYRMYYYIDNAFSIEKMENPNHFYYAGVAFGEFATFLNDFDASSLFETIKNFHNTASRYLDFEASVDADVKDRAKDVQKEIEFVRERKDFMSLFVNKLQNGELPLRVTHNDTKLNNVLFDISSETPVAVIDLDTVMPGSYLYDFGDAIRSGATHAAEDEQNLDLVDFDLELYDNFARGYLGQCAESLTQEEIKMLPYASIMLTLECGMRFLTDHLNGDTYFRIRRENHNLDRARTQFKLVAEMENNIDKMRDIIMKYVNK